MLTRHKYQFRTAILTILTVMSGCGGGDGGGDGGVVLPTPAPAPSPAPSPSSSPSTAPTGVTYSVMALGPIVGTFWVDNNKDGNIPTAGDSSGMSSIDGKFGPSATNPTAIFPDTYSLAAGGNGVDLIGGYNHVGFKAPAGASIISPLTTVIAAHGFESSIRQTLDAGSDGIRPTTSVLQFNPLDNLNNPDTAAAKDAARILALNLQILALGQTLSDFTGDPPAAGADVGLAARYIAAQIRDGKGGPLTDRTVLLDLLRRSARINSGDANLSRVADYLETYFRAMPTHISSLSEARAWLNVFRFAVFSEFISPFGRNGQSTGPTSTDLQSLFAILREEPLPTPGRFLPQTDYYELTSHPIADQNYRSVSSNCTSSDNRLPTCNDLIDFYAPPEDSTGKPVVKFTNPRPANPAILSVVANADGTLELRRIGTFIGYTWFTYTAQAPSGATATGRAYVRIR